MKNQNKQEVQHVLTNTNSIDHVIERAHIKHTDTILDLCAGSGEIVLKVLEKSKKVVAYQKDKKLAREIKSKLSGKKQLFNKLNLIEEDVLSAELPHFDKIISNVPFSLSVPVILSLIKYNFHSAYILVQKEFADRLVARPGDKNYSRLTVSFKSMFKAENILKVKKGNFTPAMKIDACWIKITKRADALNVNVEEFDNLMKVCFCRKNKTLSGNLNTPQFERFLKETEFKNTKKFVEDVLTHLNLKNARSSKMSIDEFYKLYQFLKEKGINFEY